VIAGDLQVVIAASAAIADEATSGEQEDREVEDEDPDHRREHGRRGRIAEGADDRAGEGEDDDESGDLRKRLLHVQVRRAAHDAAPEVAGVVHRGIPSQEDLLPGVENHAGRALCRIDGRSTDSASALVSEIDSHRDQIVTRIAGCHTPTAADAASCLPRARAAGIVTPMSSHLESLRGRFLVFDGPDGSGKSTQCGHLADRCRAAGLTVCEARAPGGTPIGEQIRAILLDPTNDAMGVRCELMLYMASRAQLVEEHIAPALDRGEVVLSDRFISSTLAYQGAAGGIDAAAILDVGRVAVGGHWPDLTIIVDVDEATAAARLDRELDRIEQKDAAFHRRVRQGFLDQAAAQPEHTVVIDGRGDRDDVSSRLIETLATWIAAQPLS